MSMNPNSNSVHQAESPISDTSGASTVTAVGAFAVGQRVRIRKSVGDAPSGESPGGVFGGEGDVVIVRRIEPTYAFPIAVSHEWVTDGRMFGVTADEIEPE